MRTKSRGLKTWSAFGNLGRRPSEYEILTHGLNHTVGDPPLDLGPDVNGNTWLRQHRDAIGLTVADWDEFRDPDAMTYASYVSGQDDQETYVEGLLEQFDEAEDLSPATLEFLALTLTPGRYLAHGQQMLSAYIQQLALSSYVATCATFQTADQLRRVQLLAYRTVQLQRAFPEAGFGVGERAAWQEHPDWQPIREAVERALIEFDWDRALVATQLVVKPVADLLFLAQLGPRLADAGSTLDALIVENLWRDARRSRRWTTALVQFIVDADQGNRAVLQGYLDEWTPRGLAMIEAGGRLLGSTGTVVEGWRSLVEPAGLALTGVPR